MQEPAVFSFRKSLRTVVFRARDTETSLCSFEIRLIGRAWWHNKAHASANGRQGGVHVASYDYKD